MSDGPLLPGQGGAFRPAEQPEKLRRLVEGLEGQTLSVLHYFDDEGPTGSRGLGFELASGERWMVWAARSNDSHKYTAVLAWRMLRAPQIWTPARHRHFASGRSADLTLGPPDELQRRVEGQQIRGLHLSETPTKKGGEAQRLEFKDGSRLELMAAPISKTIYHKEPGSLERLTADIEWEYVGPPERSLILPGGQT